MKKKNNGNKKPKFYWQTNYKEDKAKMKIKKNTKKKQD